MTYHVVVIKNWNKTIVDEDVHAFDPTQDEEDNVFFDQAPPTYPHEHLHVLWKGLAKI